MVPGNIYTRVRLWGAGAWLQPLESSGEDKLTCAGGSGHGGGAAEPQAEPQHLGGPHSSHPNGLGFTLSSGSNFKARHLFWGAAVPPPCPFLFPGKGKVAAARISDPWVIPCSSHGCGHGGTPGSSWGKGEELPGHCSAHGANNPERAAKPVPVAWNQGS